MTQAERSREIDAEVGAAEDAARVADTALTEARAALEQGEERLRVVKERWEQQRVAIAAAGGRVE